MMPFSGFAAAAPRLFPCSGGKSMEQVTDLERSRYCGDGSSAFDTGRGYQHRGAAEAVTDEQRWRHPGARHRAGGGGDVADVGTETRPAEGPAARSQAGASKRSVPMPALARARPIRVAAMLSLPQVKQWAKRPRRAACRRKPRGGPTGAALNRSRNRRRPWSSNPPSVSPAAGLPGLVGRRRRGQEARHDPPQAPDRRIRAEGQLAPEAGWRGDALSNGTWHGMSPWLINAIRRAEASGYIGRTLPEMKEPRKDGNEPPPGDAERGRPDSLGFD